MKSLTTYSNKLSPGIVQVIAEMTRLGASKADAARAAKIRPQTLDKWLSIAEREIERLQDELEQPDPNMVPYLELYYAFEEADTDIIVSCLTTLSTAAERDPVWAERVLRYKRPGLYDPKIQLQTDQTVKIDQNITLNSEPLSVEKQVSNVTQILQILQSRGALVSGGTESSSGINDTPTD